MFKIPSFKIPGFSFATEDDKVRMNRRAFLRGMTVTAAGLMVPKAAVFDQGRIVAASDPGQIVTPDEWKKLVYSSFSLWASNIAYAEGMR